MLSSITRFLAPWRGAIIGDRELVEGRIADDHAAPSPELARALAAWDGHHYWEDTPDGRWLVVVRERSGRRERWWLHALLLLLTAVTTTIAGAALAGREVPTLALPPLRTLAAGLPFSVPLLAILLAHESGHFSVARRYRVDASPPYFLPLPPVVSLVGTLGAFIKLRSPLFDRRTLFDIAVAGPLAGLAIALPALVVGLAWSDVVPGAPSTVVANQLVVLDGGVLLLGDSLLLRLLRLAVAPDGVLLLHPLAIAGWVGILVTMLNLLPLAQLDGGHITYALFGRRQHWIARGFWLALLALGFWRAEWWIWAVIALVVGRGRLAHPPVLSGERGLTPGRRRVGWLAVALFVLTFIPAPVIVP
jgi:membrane-associated protease RseP (regulator of RpoE activity)